MNLQKRQDRSWRRAKAMRLQRWQHVPFTARGERTRIEVENATSVLAWLEQHAAWMTKQMSSGRLHESR